MPLNQIKPNIYSLDGYNPENEHNPIVAVHPFYKVLGDFRLEEFFRPLLEKRMPGQVDYIRRLEEIIKTYPGPIITLEENSADNREMKKTAKYFAKLGRFSNSYFIETWFANPDPKDIGWTGLINFIAGFKGRPVKVIGGCYSKENVFGCVNKAAWMLDGIGAVEIKEEVTFSELPEIDSVLD